MSDNGEWVHLNTFELAVTSPTNQLYCNGRQQVEVTVKLQAVDTNGKSVALSDAQRASIRLIDYDSGVELPDIPPSGTLNQGWGATQSRNQYRFYPGEHTDESEAHDLTGYECFTWYVQSAELLPQKIGCKIQQDEHIIIKSNASHSNQFVELFPQQIPGTGPSTTAVDYIWESERVEGGIDERDTQTVDYYYCALLIDGNFVGFKEFTVKPASMFKWASASPTSDLFSFTGYGEPGSSTIKYQVPSIFNDRKHSEITTPRTGHGVVVLIRNDRINQQNAPDAYKGACDIDAIDNDGTDRKLRVSFDSSTRNKLTLSRR